MLQNVQDFLSKKKTDQVSVKSFNSSKYSKRSQSNHQIDPNIQNMIQNKKNSQFQTTYQQNFQTSQSSFNKNQKNCSNNVSIAQLNKEIDEKIQAILDKHSQKDRPQIEKAILENIEYFEHHLQLCLCFRCKCGCCKCVFEQQEQHKIKMQGNFGTTYKTSFSKSRNQSNQNLLNLGMNNNRGYNTRSTVNNNDYNKNSAILDKGYSTNNRGEFVQHQPQNQKLNFEFMEKDDVPQYLNTSYQKSFFDFKNLNKMEAQPNIPHSKHFHGLPLNVRPPFGYQNKKGTTFNGNFVREIKVQNPIIQIYPTENKTIYRCQTGRQSKNDKVENKTMDVLQNSLKHTYKADSLKTQDYQEFKQENICNNPTDCKTEDVAFKNTIKKLIISKINKKNN